ncbi:MAG: sodium ion-translocating decarboxylase subunit beta [Clostridiales bacterium]|jgi:Na+-transporting methylmalonyl-CoA/oxaloacetate decarboxylase beta subunit|nr:sodium ion-translocating decarboxylase subunit beta [Clostridiales bacterium]
MSKEARSFGIIGGADGPTLIYLSAKPPLYSLGLAALGLVALAAVIIIIRKRRRSNGV